MFGTYVEHNVAQNGAAEIAAHQYEGLAAAARHSIAAPISVDLHTFHRAAAQNSTERMAKFVQERDK